MKVLLDEGVPEQIGPHLPRHDVRTVRELGLKGTVNGKLLDAIQAQRFEALISNDKKLEFDQNLARCPFAILVPSTNHLPTLKPKVGKIAAALETAEKGKITRVDVGAFIPKRFRNPVP